MEQRDHNRPQAYSVRQRIVVITFETPEAAQDWDEAGRPLDRLDEFWPMLRTEVA